MIKAKKHIRFANMIKVSDELIKDGELPIWFKKNLSKLKHVPKNTLKVTFIGLEMGLSGDDFARGLKSIRVTFEIVRFKRN